MGEKSTRIYLLFLCLYAVSYMGNAVYGTFMPVYLKSIGLSQTSIATLLSFGPLIAVLAQPLWGSIGDRAESKNRVLQVLSLGSSVSILFLPISNQYLYLLTIICVVTFFQTSINPLSDAITLEHLARTKWNFGPIRLAGTIGFAIMSVAFGIVAKKNINSISIVYSLVMLFTLIICTQLPKIKGHQSSKNKVSLSVLLKNRKLMLFTLLNFIVQITLGYYYSFFPIYFNQLGADNRLLGWSMLFSSISELPFLLYGHKIIERFGIPVVLVATAFFAGLRWLFFYFVHNPYLVLPIQMLHGLIFIVLSVTLAIYINQEVPKELKASGQTLNGLLSLGLARIIGSMAGGIASEYIGMREVFLYNAMVAFLTFLVFIFIFLKESRTVQKATV
ncbi:MFS transporter [Bacillus sp. ISL-18]|uniref:MFS transporter n=1 Tax=Bacillus sp. ISL-18 TaxID=2819118 RepID=UPI001BE64FA2|nr:MFS transporter [Bacillus sp. ISL-18]MBT2658325.1 MFS transporter [Bacillus sp. ISL-18]